MNRNFCRKRMQTTVHRGLKKFRNRIEGFPEDCGIEQIRRLIKEVHEEQHKTKFQKKKCL